MSNENATGFQVGANINPFEAAMRRMVDAAKGGQDGVGNAFASLATGPLAGLKTAFAAISGILAGGFMQKAIEDTAKMTENAMDLGRALGVSTNEARAIQIAMADIGAAEGEFEGAAKGMAKKLKDNEEEMNKMGLATRDASGQLRPMTELVADGIKVLGSYKEGTDRMLASQTLFGKGLDASSKLMLYNQQVQDDARATMEEMGLTVGENAVAAWNDFDAAQDKAGFAVQGMTKAIGDSLMPVVTTLVNMFNSVMPAAIVIVRGALSGLTAAFLFVKNGVQVLWETLRLMLYSVLEPLRGLAEMIGRAMIGDFSGAVNAFKGVGANMANAWSGSLDRMADDSRKTAEQVYNLFARDDQAGSGGGPGAGTKGFVDPKEKEKEKKSSKDDTLFRSWDAELNALKQAHADKNALEGTFHEFSKEEERAFWVAKKAIAEVGKKDAFGVQAKITAATLEIQKGAFETRLAILQREQAESEQNFGRKSELAKSELALITQRYGAESKQAEDARRKIEDIERSARDQRKQLRDIELAESTAAANQQVDLERQRLQFEFDAGLITRAQQIAAEQEFEQKKYDIQVAALAIRQATIDPELNPVEYARIKGEILQVERQHQMQLGQLRSQAALENTAQQRDMNKGIRSASENNLAGMLQGTLTLQKGLQAVWNSILQGFTQLISKKVIAWSLGETAQTTATVAGNTTRTESDWMAATQSVMASAWAAVKNIAVKAWEAAASIYASVAAIPVVGPFLAPVMAVAATGVVMGYAANIASASRGYDIPAGLNPLTQLHEEEMVLPAKHAAVIRSLADDGPGQGPAAVDSAPIHIHGTPNDSIKLKDLAVMMKRMNRNAVFVS